MFRFFWIAAVLVHYLINELNSEGLCHYYSNAQMNWFDALFACQSLGLCLADLSTEVTAQNFYNHISELNSLDYTYIDYWFGLTRYEHLSFKYVSNNDDVKYATEGSNFGHPRASCAYLHAKRNGFVFYGWDCFQHKRFICSDATHCNGVKTNSSYVKGYPLKPQCEISDEVREILGIQ